MQVLLLGMPESGKSTYIGALTHILTSGRRESSLQLVGLAGYQAHAVALEERWLACDEMERTKHRTRQEGSFRVRPAAGGEEAVLLIPDLSGEAFRQTASKGMCLKGLFPALAAADGLVLFTNANRPPDDRILFDAAAQYEAIEAAFAGEMQREGLSVEEPSPSIEPEGAVKPFDPDDMPEEVLLVELLQLLNRRPLDARRRGLALVVSAWDVVKTQETPETWLARARPMLAQFLHHNSELWDLRVWGVSALGGELPKDADRLRAIKEPSERVQVIGHSAAPHDVAAPISWLMGRAGA